MPARNSRKSKPRRVLRAVSRPVERVDLLGRPVVNLDTPELQRFVAGKVILVTGAGGSIGSEICRQCLRFCPARLVMVERTENALFEVDRELNERWVGADIVPALADVTDAVRLTGVFAEHRPHIVFHAAAHKHVPMLEHNPGEAIKNNVFGTQIAAQLSADHGVGTFVLISTDKAVNPTSVMGASKRVAEMVVQGMNAELVGTQEVRGSRVQGRGVPGATIDARPAAVPRSPARSTCFTAVRFGNVLGSSGSVVPIFRRQIERGGPLTVTHPEMRRYFMTIPEASQLVMQAGAIGRGGEVFVLDMGQPIRILDLAVRLIRQAGLKPGRDIEIRMTGVRPGEKLFEELAGVDDLTLPTSHEKIRVWQLPRVGGREVEGMLVHLRRVADAPRDQVVTALARWVPEYRPGGAAPVMRIASDLDPTVTADAA